MGFREKKSEAEMLLLLDLRLHSFPTKAYISWQKGIVDGLIWKVKSSQTKNMKSGVTRKTLRMGLKEKELMKLSMIFVLRHGLE